MHTYRQQQQGLIASSDNIGMYTYPWVLESDWTNHIDIGAVRLNFKGVFKEIIICICLCICVCLYMCNKKLKTSQSKKGNRNKEDHCISLLISMWITKGVNYLPGMSDSLLLSSMEKTKRMNMQHKIDKTEQLGSTYILNIRLNCKDKT